MGIILFIIQINSIINYKFYKKLKTKGNKFIKLTFNIENRGLKFKKNRNYLFHYFASNGILFFAIY